jgi:type I restriction-modification system DNA methylase subunit
MISAASFYQRWLRMNEVSEKTRAARRKSTAEVFTPAALVNEILDKLPLDSWEEGKTYCDPAAGNGAFLVEVYKRKVEAYGHDPISALSTIYGVELMEDNTKEMKSRLFHMAVGYVGNNREEMVKILLILQKNIVCHDALTYDFEFK